MTEDEFEAPLGKHFRARYVEFDVVGVTRAGDVLVARLPSGEEVQVSREIVGFAYVETLTTTADFSEGIE